VCTIANDNDKSEIPLAILVADRSEAGRRLVADLQRAGWDLA